MRTQRCSRCDLRQRLLDEGFERTATEFRELYDEVGFELEKIVSTPSPLSIIIGKPQGKGYERRTAQHARRYTAVTCL